MKQKGIDAAGDASPTISGLVGFDMVAVPVPRNEWEMTPGRLDYYLATAKSGTPAILSAKGDLSATYAIQTREGGRGVLQIVGFTEPPHSVMMVIRYKMAKP